MQMLFVGTAHVSGARSPRTRLRLAALAVVPGLWFTGPSARAQADDGAGTDQEAALTALAERRDAVLAAPRPEGVMVGAVVGSAGAGEVLHDRGGNQHLHVGADRTLLSPTASARAYRPRHRRPDPAAEAVRRVGGGRRGARCDRGAARHRPVVAG
jgi:hypothetical protein